MSATLYLTSLLCISFQSLITALAAASGHKLVRINLSEQTDIADLMGSDLPVQSATGGASFEWCDGILLTAIKEGNWVLLDELNLASQSVLEGLNSCLDHRASVYIPELGKSFQCPPSFRVFAAQNPLAQGGGRKGLPKSFLNRFTKVFVDPLKISDLHSIVSSKHPMLEKDLVDKMIGFNNAIHNSVVEDHEFGSDGSPWEFNLRDVFRWCELIATKTSSNESYARDLYFQRFRTNEDREMIDQVYRQFFGKSLKCSGTPELEIQESSIRIGSTTLARIDSLATDEREQSLCSEPALFLSQLPPLEAVARCVLLRWPCLLVGHPASGKTSIVSSLAEICNVKLVEQGLSPSSDVTELIGCFEQVASMAEQRQAVEELYEYAHQFLRLDGIRSQVCRQVLEHLASLESCLGDFGSSFNLLVERGGKPRSKAEELCSILLTGMKTCRSFQAMYAMLVESVATKFEQWSQPGGLAKQNGIAGHFVWRDGVLVEAMTKGYWLVLENVNLCPSSVLDRLNSVMETDGVLLLSECGVGEGGSSSHRTIRPHPNFRVFLTMNPSNGEISRAMRNRCVEVALVQSTSNDRFRASADSSEAIRTVSDEEKVDFLDMLTRAGARSFQLASSLQVLHYQEYDTSIKSGEEPPCLRGVSGGMSILKALLSRGISGNTAILCSTQVAFEIEAEKTSEYFAGNRLSELTSPGYTPLPVPSSLRNSWIRNGQFSRVDWQSRLMRLFMDNTEVVMESLASSELGLLHLNDVEGEPAVQYEILEVRKVDETRLRDALLRVFLGKMSSVDAESRFTYFRGLNNSTSIALGWMGSMMRVSLMYEIGRNVSSPEVRALQLLRLPQQLREKLWLSAASRIQTPVESSRALKVLDASFLFYETLLDRSSFPCPVTPFLFPFFLAVDEMTSHLIQDCYHLENTLAGSLSHFLCERDRLWVHLETSPVLLKEESFLCFEESEFIVQWKWLKKSFLPVASASKFFSSGARTSMRKVEALILAIDSVIFNSEASMLSTHKMRKKMIRPAVPPKAGHFEKILRTRSLLDDCAILGESRFNPFESFRGPVELTDLVDICHPVFFIQEEQKIEFLAALCTMHWSWTGEVGGTEHSLFEEVEFYDKLKDSFEEKRKHFIRDIAKAKVDAEIATVENQINTEMLESLRTTSTEAISSNEAYARVTKTILSSFGNIQISALAEYWSTKEEIDLCGSISRLLLESDDEEQLKDSLLILLPGLKRLVNVIVSGTAFSVVDIRAHQTLLWAIEGGSPGEIPFRHFLRCLLPQLMCSMSKHMWHNSFSGLNMISARLELPNMWIDDDVGHRQESRQLWVPSYASARLCHQVRSEFLIHTFGKQLAWSKSHESGKYHTMENHRCRSQQYHDIIRLLSTVSFPEGKTRLYTSHFIMSDMLEAVEEFSSCSSIAQILPLLRKPELLVKANLNECKDKAPAVRGEFSRLHLDDLVIPFLEALQQAWKSEHASKEYNEQLALSSVYLGILRLHIVAPDSPLDPGRAPLAKISLIDKKLTSMKTDMAALRLDSGFIQGNFTPGCQDTIALLHEGHRLAKKQISQQKKVVERISLAPPFFELFREVKDFLETVSAKTTVLGLVKGLLEGDREEAARKIENWLRTASAFCERLNSRYGAYEDVTAVLIDSLHMIQDGLMMVLESRSSSDEVDEVGTTELFRLLLLFPMQHHPSTIESLVSFLSCMISGKGEVVVHKKSELLFSISLAVLARLLLKKRLEGLSFEEVSWSCNIFETLAQVHLAGNSKKLLKEETIEDVQERNFREQFPNHRKDFHSLLEENTDSWETAVDEADQSESAEDRNELTDLQIELLCSMHHGLFSDEFTSPSDALRNLAFHACYNAAYAMERALGCSHQSSTKAEPLGSHVLAMSLTSLPRKGTQRVNSHLSNKSGYLNFQSDPCPAEAMSAADPLERLMARATQLLTAFPGHSILLGLGKVCEKVRKLDLMTTPIGKVMSGLEIILRQAQDWEQHASERVQLGQALKDIAQLVARWRKLEMESWSQLILGRQERQVFNAKKYLIRLHRILHNEESKNSVGTKVDPSCNPFTQHDPCTPRWIWKGFAAQQSLAALFEYDNYEELTDLVKALDTFILTSPLGEFNQRLRILDSLSVQLLTEYNTSNNLSSWKLQQSRAVSSISFYYSQFRGMLDSKLESLKGPIESKLRDEVKLAKWDEQSYYSLAESSERNHRKLMKIISEMDECLGLNVGVLIQEDTCRGIRSSPDTQDEFCASMPSNALMFPLGDMDQNEKRKEVDWKSRGIDSKDRNWIDATAVGAPADSHLYKMQKYANKMQSMIKGNKSIPKSWAATGSESASSFCDAIFERISSLRAKSTRPMKERALVDLFRELKRSGFSTTKWAIPKELRHIEHIFQLPKPKIDGVGLSRVDQSQLQSAEQYYARCLTELSSFRSETLMLGSKYMTTREMNLMVCLSESVLLMISQQRCLIANAILDTSALVDCVSEMHFEDSNLPSAQSMLRGRTRDFERCFVNSIECVKELSLLLRSSQNLLDTTSKVEWTRDTLTKLETLVAASHFPDCQVNSAFVTWKDMKLIDAKGKVLQQARSVLCECRKGCKDLECLPLDVFDAATEWISRTIEIHEECKKTSMSAETHGEHRELNIGFISSLSFAVERLLISFQNLSAESSISERSVETADSGNDEIREDYSILDCHKGLMAKWAKANLKELLRKLNTVRDQLRSIHDTVGSSKEQRQAFVGLVSDLSILSDYVKSSSESFLHESLQFYFSTSKFLYLILRVFRVLVSKGYCADKTSEDDDQGVDGDINGMAFEDDQEGTGMGEGEGKNDVTDQLENEDQLAGLKSDDVDDKLENQESRQLNEEEADQGMEMENDFDGDLCDIPDKERDDDMEENEGEEELDRELGENASPDEQVVDEKMWNDSDDEDDINKDEEKFEKNSAVEGEAIEGETRTKEEEEDESDPSKDAKKDDDSRPEEQHTQSDDAAEDTMDLDQEGDDQINEGEDNVEEKNGVDVRGNENEPQEEDNNNDGDMDLDNDVCLDEGDNEDTEEGAEELNAENDEKQEDSESVGSEVGENHDTTDIPGEEDETDPASAITPQGQGTVEDDAGRKEEDEPDDDPSENDAFQSMQQDPSTAEAHGVKSQQGTDAVMDDGADDNTEEKEDNDEEPTNGTTGASQALDSQRNNSGQGGGYSENDGGLDNSAETNNEQKRDDIPNPFKNPGDASKFWHKKLNIVDSDPANEPEGGQKDDAVMEEETGEKRNGEFEFTPQEQNNSTQVLGEATEEEAKKLDQMQSDTEEETAVNEKEDGKAKHEEPSHPKRDKASSRHSLEIDSASDESVNNADAEEVMSTVDDEIENDTLDETKGQESTSEDEAASGNVVGTGLSNLTVGEQEDEELPSALLLDEQATGISSAEGVEARLKWLQIQGETHNLARRLCEKLRLVLEPLVASKLRGDYRTGKRINMKRVIGYIASGYRKDKIWLKRTKPAKRDYRVLLAVDDSESMQKSGAGDMALRAMATLAVGMNQLEVGELGIASFGEDMKLLHPYHLPFTSESGADMVGNFRFNQQRTRTALCVESALASLEQSGGSSSMQLVFMISDGRIERDSRAGLKRLMREMAERNILLAMIIVEGKSKKKDSIVHMKEVSFEKGKPVVKRFIEDYPFPYYIILEDMSSLPEVLGDALKQWFEMMAQLHGAK
eukprot:scaffold2271_cov130-Cylindrotheca_fusiformis.AAC.22